MKNKTLKEKIDKLIKSTSENIYKAPNTETIIYNNGTHDFADYEENFYANTPTAVKHNN